MARPLDLGRPALLSMEMQRGVVGDLSRIQVLTEAVERTGIVAKSAALMRAARAAGVTVIHCNAEYRADLKGSNANAPMLRAMIKQPDHILAGSPGAEVDQRLGAQPEDIILRRYHGVSPFTGTALDMTLRSLKVDTVIATGVSINLGIMGLCIEAVNFGYRVILARDCVAGFPQDYADAVLNNTLNLVATISDSQTIADQLANLPA